MKQLDLIDDDPRRVAEKMARAERIYAEKWLRNPFYPVSECERRHAMHTQIAEQYEQQLRAVRPTG